MKAGLLLDNSQGGTKYFFDLSRIILYGLNSIWQISIDNLRSRIRLEIGTRERIPETSFIFKAHISNEELLLYLVL